jgi:hypothetical protein
MCWLEIIILKCNGSILSKPTQVEPCFRKQGINKSLTIHQIDTGWSKHKANINVSNLQNLKISMQKSIRPDREHSGWYGRRCKHLWKATGRMSKSMYEGWIKRHIKIKGTNLYSRWQIQESRDHIDLE